MLHACAVHVSELSFSFLEVQPESVNAWSKRKCGCRVRRLSKRITCPPPTSCLQHTVHVFAKRDLHLDL